MTVGHGQAAWMHGMQAGASHRVAPCMHCTNASRRMNA